jgi:copper chaperone
VAPKEAEYNAVDVELLSENEMEHLVVGIVGMHCQGCVKNVTGILRALPGVSRVEVSMENGNAEIDYDPQLAGPAQFTDAIESAGFEAK